jgi:ABC-2 type transport system ATP-binding protein
MEQVEEICEHIVLINKGENVLEGKVSAVKDRFKQNLFELEYEGELPEGLLERAKVIDQQPGRLTVQVAETTESNTLLRAMLDRGVFVKRFQEILPTLNEIFIRQVN